MGRIGTKLQGTGEDYMMKSLLICTLTQYFSGNHIERNVMGVTCHTYGEKRGVYRVLMGKLSQRDHLEVSGLDGMIILRSIFR